MATVQLYNNTCEGSSPVVSEDYTTYGFVYTIKATGAVGPQQQPEGVEINDARLVGKVVTKVTAGLQSFTPDLFTKNVNFGKIVMSNFTFYDGLQVVVDWQNP